MGAGTAAPKILVANCYDEEYTISVRAFELGVAMGRFDRHYNVKRTAQEFSLSPSGAYRLLCRVSGSRKVMVVEDEGDWYIPRELDAKDWPY